METYGGSLFVLRLLLIGLAATYVLSFLGGFLQATPFNFVNYIFFALLCIGGIALMTVTGKSETGTITKAFLFLTGISSALLFIFFILYEWARLQGYVDLHRSVEGFLYLLTLFFWIFVIVSLVLVWRTGVRD